MMYSSFVVSAITMIEKLRTTTAIKRSILDATLIDLAMNHALKSAATRQAGQNGGMTNV